LVAAGIIAAPVVALTGLVSASPAAQDQILYYQTKNSTYVQYVPVSGTTVTQTLSAGTGTCPRGTVSNPAPSPASGALLPISASYYAKGYSGTSTSASVGTYQYQTGVCSPVGTGWSVGPNEGLVFSIGQGNALTQGRVFSQATIPLERDDFNRGSLSGTLVLRRMTSGTEATVGTVPFTLARADGDDDADDITVVNTGVFTAGFDQVEVQVNSPSTGAVSVVGPASNGDNDGGDAPAPAVEATFYLDSAPSISGANNTTFTVGTLGSMTVTASGYPTPALSDASTATCTTALPSGVSFSSTSGSGAATISGTPGAGTGGTYNVCITASNANSTLTKSFTLTVDQAPAITSANTVTFPAGGGSPDFTVTTTGYPSGPTLTLKETGPLPSGVNFTDNENGTATITNTAAATAGGSYPITITASNGVSPNATQSFTIVVDQAPAITSANTVTFPAGGGSPDFTVTTTGYPSGPILTLKETGTLPSGVNFTDNGDGTATITNTAAAGTGGSYPITITASNGVSPDATQSFTLTVDQAPAFTSAPTDIVPAGAPFTASVMTTGNPTAKITNTAFGSCSPSTLPASVSFTDNENGTATIAGTPADGDAGTYTLCLVADNGVSPDATQTFTLVITAPGAPFKASQQGGSPVTAGITLTSGYKSFTGFTTCGGPGSTSPCPAGGPAGSSEEVNWDTTPGTGTYAATAVLTWLVPYCTPTGDNTVVPPIPACGPTDITLNGNTVQQSFCISGPPPGLGTAWCTTKVDYTFLNPDADGTPTQTLITEDWSGYGDPTWSRG
jgi:predicted secreted protein